MDSQGTRRFYPSPYWSWFFYAVGLIQLPLVILLVGAGYTGWLSLAGVGGALFLGSLHSQPLLLVDGVVVKIIGNRQGYATVLDQLRITDIVAYRTLSSGEAELDTKGGRRVRVPMHKIDKRHRETVESILSGHLPENRRGSAVFAGRHPRFEQWLAARRSKGPSAGKE